MTKYLRFTAALALCACSAGSHSSQLTVAECFEGSDFIANAALARDNGMSRSAFLGRMEDDFELIQAYPPQLRWFAKDHDDEAFLFDSARRVFDAPQPPEAHRAQFLAACFNRGAA